MASEPDNTAVEKRALAISKWGNLFMGTTGVIAAILSNSSAVLVDGLFSLIGFSAAVIGARISARVHLAPTRSRPVGYAADEAIYQTFRALSLLGLTFFAVGNAILNIADYVRGGEIAELNYGPLLTYFVVICVVCFSLAYVHYSAWKRTGQVSAMLRLEAKATLFDGIMTVAGGLGLAILPLFKGGMIGWLAPVGDSLIVLALCGAMIGRNRREFMNGLGELAGVSAGPEILTKSRRVARGVVQESGGRLVDLSVTKLGRTVFVLTYLDPERPVMGSEIDDITRKLDKALAEPSGRVVSIVLVTEKGRSLTELEHAE